MILIPYLSTKVGDDELMFQSNHSENPRDYTCLSGLRFCHAQLSPMPIAAPLRRGLRP